MKHISITVSGKVQGVFYRASTKAKADELGVNGFVTNKADGSVYIEAEADPEKLDAFQTWCKQGPSRAEVLNLDIKEGSPQNFSSFRIIR